MPAKGYKASKTMDKYREFALCYMSNGYNATQAYITVYKPADPTSHSVRQSAYVVKSKPEVQQIIKEEQDKRYKELNINAEHIAQELAEMAFAMKGDENYTAQVKLKALELLQKQLGLQTKNVKAEAEVSAAVTFVDDLKPDEDKSE